MNGSNNRKINFIDRFFKISERGSSISKEIISGIIVFLAIVFVFPVISNVLKDTGMPTGGVFTATVICSALASIIMGIFSNYPIVLSGCLGINAFVAYTVCSTLGYSWQEAMLLVFISGVLFVIISITPLREKIVNVIPNDIKTIITAGLGMFLCFVGLNMGGIVVSSESTIVKLGELSNPTVLLSLAGIFVVFILLSTKNEMIKKLAIVIAMVIIMIVGIVLGLCGVKGMPEFSGASLGNISDIKNVIGKCFESKNFNIFTKFETYAIIFSIILISLFESTATLFGVSKNIDMIDKNGILKDGKKAMIADAIMTPICGIMGTTTITNYAQSTIGVESGARTGLSSITSGLLFGLTLLILPVFSIFMPIGEAGITPITALALVSVGALMFSNLKDINWKDNIIVFTAFITIIMMLLTYSIVDGIGFGIILYCLMMLVSKRGKEVSYLVYIISMFFIINYILTIFVLG